MQKVSKLNSSIDIIPLQGSSENCRSRRMDNRHGMEQRSLISRVRMYMRENENKVYIDVNDMADALQKRYIDYRSKKRSAFRAKVRKAYDEITEMHVKKTPMRDYPNYDDDFEDDDIDESDSQHALLDDMSLHKKSRHKQNGNSSDKELIDISSDDEVFKVDSKIEEKCMKTPENTCNAATKSSPVLLRPNTITSKPETSTPKAELSVSKIETPMKTPLDEITKQSLLKQTKSIRKRQRDKYNDSEQFPIAKKVRNMPIIESKVKFSDMGGINKVLETIHELLYHMIHPEVFKHLGISPPRGFLLHGPPGCGKTLLAHAVAGELNVPLLKVTGSELVAGISGESEARIRELFEEALSIAPCVLFLDEIDAIATNRATAQKEMEKRIVTQILSSLDDLNHKENGDRVLIIGATNQPDSLDPALRRAGRFDREICLGIPDREARLQILTLHTKTLALAPNVNLSRIAFLTPGFVGADLVALVREACIAAIKRIYKDLYKSKEEEKLPQVITAEKNKQLDKEVQTCSENSENPDDINVTMEVTNTANETPILLKDIVQSPENAEMDVIQTHSSDSLTPNLLTLLHNKSPLSLEQLSVLYIEQNDFEAVLRIVQPSAKREGFATVPDVTWDDVGSLQDIRQELQMMILGPIKYSEEFNALGLTVSGGILLYGPPGCGKTLLAKAIANEAGINFISVKGPELLNMYVGESEKAVRQCFLRARYSMPCVIFFDELDALCPTRTGGDNSVTSRVVNQMLTEMDGIEGREGVFLMAASNRPDIIDPAVLRPGRLDKMLYVGLPTALDRVDILRALTKNGTRPKLASDVDLDQIGHNEKCEGYTGADLGALIREASMQVCKEIIAGHRQTGISMRHILQAFDNMQPSVRENDMRHYEKLRKQYSVKKNSEVTPMETPIDVPIDVVMEPMET